MTENPRLEYAATIVSVRDIATSVAFYTDVLGFAAPLVAEDNGFAIVRRDGAAIHLLQTDNAEALAATANNVAIYIMTTGVVALYAQIEHLLDGLPEDRVRPPFLQDYGMREFHVKDPDGCLLFFAEDA